MRPDGPRTTPNQRFTSRKSTRRIEPDSTKSPDLLFCRRGGRHAPADVCLLQPVWRPGCGSVPHPRHGRGLPGGGRDRSGAPRRDHRLAGLAAAPDGPFSPVDHPMRHDPRGDACLRGRLWPRRHGLLPNRSVAERSRRLAGIRRRYEEHHRDGRPALLDHRVVQRHQGDLLLCGTDCRLRLLPKRSRVPRAREHCCPPHVGTVPQPAVLDADCGQGLDRSVWDRDLLLRCSQADHPTQHNDGGLRGGGPRDRLVHPRLARHHFRHPAGHDLRDGEPRLGADQDHVPLGRDSGILARISRIRGPVQPRIDRGPDQDDRLHLSLGHTAARYR